MSKEKSNLKNAWILCKRFWRYVWHGDDALSWALSIIIAFIIIKFMFYPAIGFALGTSHPIVAVVSGSMEHKITENERDIPNICGKQFSETQRLAIKEYWGICGQWYEDNTNISLQDFNEYHYTNGINTGDVIILRNPGTTNLDVGDVIVFIQKKNPSKEPIIHRIVNIKNESGELIFQTKGDHNADQINVSTRSKYLNEYHITENEIIGKALISIPYVGYIKILAYKLILFIGGIL